MAQGQSGTGHDRRPQSAAAAARRNEGRHGIVDSPFQTHDRRLLCAARRGVRRRRGAEGGAWRVLGLGWRQQTLSLEGACARLRAPGRTRRDGAGTHAGGRGGGDRNSRHRVRRDRPMSAQLSAHVREEIDRWVAKFPPDRKRYAVISALHAAQHENNGFLTSDLMDAVAAYLGLAPIQVYEVATFYSMFETKPVGRHHISVCTNISCMLRGSQEVVDHVESKLGIKTGESTPDGRIYLKREEECLAACTGAPMMMVDHVFHENLTPESIDKILDELT